MWILYKVFNLDATASQSHKICDHRAKATVKSGFGSTCSYGALDTVVPQCRSD